MSKAELEQAVAARDAAQAAAAGSQLADAAPAATSAATSVELATVVAEAAAGAERLSASLTAASQLLSTLQQPPGPSPAPSAAPATRRVARRTPVRLRPGTTEESLEAADQLLRTPGAVLLVDGYNISHAVWWDHPIAAQRDRLVSALAELHARTSVDIEVVFDGAEVERGPALTPRAAVRVRFSPPGVEADDVILDLAASIPVNRPVIVASSDRRVREGARRQGANVLGARQLTEALRR
jgi:predicted RNA-binding protein with PIN domain